MNINEILELMENKALKSIFEDRFTIDEDGNFISDYIQQVDSEAITKAGVKDAILFCNGIDGEDFEEFMKYFKYRDSTDWRVPDPFELNAILLTYRRKRLDIPVLNPSSQSHHVYPFYTFRSTAYCDSKDYISTISYNKTKSGNYSIEYKPDRKFYYYSTILVRK